MIANLENLKSALAACAKAHNAELCDWSEQDGQIAVKSETVPTVNDVKMICEAFFGTASVVEVGYGYTNVYLDMAPYKESVDEVTLYMALPYGTII